MLDLVKEDNSLRDTSRVSVKGKFKKGATKDSPTKDKDNVEVRLLNSAKREPKDTKGKIKKSPPKPEPVVLDNEPKV